MENIIILNNDNDSWDNENWKLIPFNVPVAILEAPEDIAEVKSHELVESLPGEYGLMLGEKKEFISNINHDLILDKSIKEYDEIWRKLAER